MDLSRNSLTSVSRTAFVNLRDSVEAIYLDHNRLRSLKEETFIMMTNLKSLRIHNNDWVCDCRLKDFREWILSRGLYTVPTSCVEPERLSGKKWRQVRINRI